MAKIDQAVFPCEKWPLAEMARVIVVNLFVFTLPLMLGVVSLGEKMGSKE